MQERNKDDVQPAMGAAMRIVDPIIGHDPNEREAEAYLLGVAVRNNFQRINDLTSAVVFQITHYKIL